MKNAPQFFILLAFAICLITGFWLGLELHTDRSSAEYLERTHILPIEPNGQRTFLLIFVDDISQLAPTPHSILLLTYTPTLQWFKFMPIYPSREQDLQKDAEIASQFQLTRFHTLAPDFRQTLGQRGLDWQGTLIVDRSALIQAIDMLEGVEINQRRLNGVLAMNILYPADAKEPMSLDSQAQLLQALCNSAAQFNTLQSLKNVQNNTLADTNADFDLELALGEWVLLLRGGHACDLTALSFKTTPSHP